jgi:hypothetical protein
MDRITLKHINAFKVTEFAGVHSEHLSRQLNCHYNNRKSMKLMREEVMAVLGESEIKHHGDLSMRDASKDCDRCCREKFCPTHPTNSVKPAARALIKRQMAQPGVAGAKMRKRQLNGSHFVEITQSKDREREPFWNGSLSRLQLERPSFHFNVSMFDPNTNQTSMGSN